LDFFSKFPGYSVGEPRVTVVLSLPFIQALNLIQSGCKERRRDCLGSEGHSCALPYATLNPSPDSGGRRPHIVGLDDWEGWWSLQRIGQTARPGGLIEAFVRLANGSDGDPAIPWAAYLRCSMQSKKASYSSPSRGLRQRTEIRARLPDRRPSRRASVAALTPMAEDSKCREIRSCCRVNRAVAWISISIAGSTCNTNVLGFFGPQPDVGNGEKGGRHRLAVLHLNVDQQTRSACVGCSTPLFNSIAPSLVSTVLPTELPGCDFCQAPVPSSSRCVASQASIDRIIQGDGTIAIVVGRRAEPDSARPTPLLIEPDRADPPIP
jgi:hypothetical protein